MTANRVKAAILSPQFLVCLMFVLGISAGMLWFFNTFEKKEVDVYRPGSKKAQMNPLLAAERFLTASGMQVESMQGVVSLFDEFPSKNDAIFVKRIPGGTSREKAEQLLNWVESGGHLIFIPNPIKADEHGDSLLLEKINAGYLEDDCGCDEKHDTPKEENEETLKKDVNRSFSRIREITLEDDPIELQLFSSRLLDDLDSQADFAIDAGYKKIYKNKKDQSEKDHGKYIHEDGFWLLQYKISEGKITVLADTAAFHNKNIGNFDHAYLLSWLLEDRNKVWIFRGVQVEPVLEIIWNKLKYFWITIGIILSLLLWKFQKRGGPVYQLNNSKRFNILEHIDATGQYNWQLDKAEVIVNANRKTLLNLLAVKKLGPNSVTELNENNITELSEITKIDKKDLHDAFNLQVTNEQEMIKVSRILQIIQKHIQSGEQN